MNGCFMNKIYLSFIVPVILFGHSAFARVESQDVV